MARRASVQDPRQTIIAILTMHDANHGFRGNRENFIDIIRTGQQLSTTVYVTTVRDLNLNARSILGFQYDDASGLWVRKMFPLPHVLYNRIPFREDEKLPDIRAKIEECLKHPGIRLFNPYFFNKWTLFGWLQKSPSTKKYVPMTRRLKKNLDLNKLLKKHTLLYLKPESGKAGKGIMRISKKANNNHLQYLLSIQEGKRSQTHLYKNLTQLWKTVSNHVGDEQYIVQQGISLSRSDRRPFDLRLLVQKNRHGRWSLSGIGARVAGSLSITTHVPRGGSIDNPRKLLTQAFDKQQANHILRQVKKASLLMARQIEKGQSCPLGEMSMDLGVDENGHIWFFEANAKPMKFDETDIRQKSLEQIVWYCKHLAKSRRKTYDKRR